MLYVVIARIDYVQIDNKQYLNLLEGDVLLLGAMTMTMIAQT